MNQGVDIVEHDPLLNDAEGLPCRASKGNVIGALKGLKDALRVDDSPRVGPWGELGVFFQKLQGRVER